MECRALQEVWLKQAILAGKRILVLEDEYLIAMDVEQLCRDHGADDVVILRSLDSAAAHLEAGNFHAAILDVMLSGQSTIDFAQHLTTRHIPFIFATGYSERDDLFHGFPDVSVVAKPYAGPAIIEAIERALSRGLGTTASGGV
jgi:CheY-like chemotaxis protein